MLQNAIQHFTYLVQFHKIENPDNAFSNLHIDDILHLTKIYLKCMYKNKKYSATKYSQLKYFCFISNSSENALAESLFMNLLHSK